MCLSISGRCLISQFLFKESANRGKCLQPCRRFYYIKDKKGNELKIENHHVLSPKDLCTLPFIEGKIKHYYPKISVGLIRLTSSLKIGDEIYIIGNKTGLIRTAIKSMQISHKTINEAMKFQEIAIKLPYCRKNDEVYKIIKRNTNI